MKLLQEEVAILEIKIDGKTCMSNGNETLLQLALRNGIEIPHLCYKKGFEAIGSCRMCIVEVIDGNRSKIVSSCQFPIKDGIEVKTDTEEIKVMRKDIVMLLYLKSPENLKIKQLATEYGVVTPLRYIEEKNDDCILCGLCVKACKSLGTSAISMVGRGTYKKVSTPYDDESLDCIGCNSCAEICPTNAIKTVDEGGKRTIWNRTFDLVKCEICGKYFTTEETFEYVKKSLGDDDLERVCDSCKKKHTAVTFKESFKDIY